MRDEFVEIKMYVTTNYDQFIFLPENRPVRGNVVGNSILKKNLLLDNPILVTPLMEVLDGQNRLVFARENTFPFYKTNSLGNYLIIRTFMSKKETLITPS